MNIERPLGNPELKYNLVVIDGSGSILKEPIMAALAGEGFKVASRTDYSEVLSSLGELKPDLIILDAGLRRENFKACRKLRQVTAIPILMLGDASRASGWVSAVDAGADLYLVKPVSCLELVARLKAILRRAKCSLGGLK